MRKIKLALPLRMMFFCAFVIFEDFLLPQSWTDEYRLLLILLILISAALLAKVIAREKEVSIRIGLLIILIGFVVISGEIKIFAILTRGH